MKIGDGIETKGRGIMQDALLKLQVKMKLLHSGKVPMNAKEWQLRPLRRDKRGYTEGEIDWQLKPLRIEKQDYSG